MMNILSPGQILAFFKEQSFWSFDQLSHVSGIAVSDLKEMAIDLNQMDENFFIHADGIGVNYPIDVIPVNEISWHKDHVYHFISLPSTNDFLKDHIHKDHLTLCVTEHQSHGRGQFQRSWHSPLGQNIMFSIGSMWNASLTQLSQLNLALAVMVVNGLKVMDLDQGIVIKSPNDLMLDGKKLGGILVELISRGDCHQVIMGVGLNVNMQSCYNFIDQPWVSLASYHQRTIDRLSLINEILDACLLGWEMFLENGFDFFKDQWLRLQVKE